MFRMRWYVLQHSFGSIKPAALPFAPVALSPLPDVFADVDADPAADEPAIPVATDTGALCAEAVA